MSLPFSQQVTADATCRLLQAGSGLAAHIAVTSVFTGQIWGAVAATAGTVGMEALGRAAGCYNNPDDAPGFPSGDPLYVPGCKKINCQRNSSGYMRGGYFQYTKPDGSTAIGNGGIKEFISATIEDIPGYGPHRFLRWIDCAGDAKQTFESPPYDKVEILVASPATCAEAMPPDPGADWEPDTPIGPTYEYNDEETGCTWQIKPYDAYLDSKGQPVFHWKATSNDPVNCGGPYEWWGNGQEPDIPAFEDPRGPDARPTPPTIPPGPGDDLKDRLDKIEELIEQLKECACPEEEPIEGEFRTISFRSDETSPFGKSRLRKRLRYRSRSGIELGALVDHWKDFSWESGPVRVQHLGASWGAPSVWAASIDEGKRVLLHAAGEAGIDPNQVGRWKIGSSNNSRIGVSDTMRVDTTGGYYWITDRDGSDQRPVVKRV